MNQRASRVRQAQRHGKMRASRLCIIPFSCAHVDGKSLKMSWARDQGLSHVNIMGEDKVVSRAERMTEDVSASGSSRNSFRRRGLCQKSKARRKQRTEEDRGILESYSRCSAAAG